LGIAPVLRERIFEPFFTTKPRGAGTGIGLSLCQAIVTEHGGTIEVSERPGGGARFTLRLPMGELEHLAPLAEAETPSARWTANILVVDDELEIGLMLQEVLERDGYRVTLAAGGANALTLLAEGRFDLVLSDLRMADGNGVELYQAITSQYPELAHRFMAMTGDTLGSTRDRLLPEVRLCLIEKPIDLAALRRTLAERLAGFGGGRPAL
jgi:CheY-like chemotaxis protein